MGRNKGGDVEVRKKITSWGMNGGMEGKNEMWGNIE